MLSSTTGSGYPKVLSSRDTSYLSGFSTELRKATWQGVSCFLRWIEIDIVAAAFGHVSISRSFSRLVVTSCSVYWYLSNNEEGWEGKTSQKHTKQRVQLAFSILSRQHAEQLRTVKSLGIWEALKKRSKFSGESFNLSKQYLLPQRTAEQIIYNFFAVLSITVRFCFVIQTTSDGAKNH